MYSPLSTTISLTPIIDDWSEEEEDEIPAPPFSPCVYSSDDDSDSIGLPHSSPLSVLNGSEDESVVLEEMEVDEANLESDLQVQ